MANYHEDNAKIKNTMEVFSRYSDFIYTIFRSKVESDDLAEDLFQDFFLKLANKPLPENVENIKSYLYKSITNSVYDSIRKLKANKINLQKYRENLSFSINDVPSSTVIYSKSEILFEKGIKLLTNSEKKIFELLYKEGFNIDEISTMTGLKKNTISRYISISLKKIRDIVGEDF